MSIFKMRKSPINWIWAFILVSYFVLGFFLMKSCNKVIAQNTISGTVRYHINNHPVRAVISLGLLSCPNYALDTSDINGNWQFNNVPDSTYFISAAEVLHQPGGYNATDAMQAAQFAVKLINLDILQQIVADVNNSGYVNAVDCFIILKTFGMGTHFTFEWLSEQKMITCPYLGPNIIDVICYGDVNASYLP